MSCTLHDVHDPQSASASITAPHFSAMSCRRSSGAGLVNVGLVKRMTSAPRSRKRASMRSRKRSPRGLEMSRSATHTFSSEASRGRLRVAIHQESLRELEAATRLGSLRSTLGVLSGALLLALVYALTPHLGALVRGVPVVPAVLALSLAAALGGLFATFAMPRGPRPLRLGWLFFRR